MRLRSIALWGWGITILFTSAAGAVGQETRPDQFRQTFRTINVAPLVFPAQRIAPQRFRPQRISPVQFAPFRFPSQFNSRLVPRSREDAPEPLWLQDRTSDAASHSRSISQPAATARASRAEHEALTRAEIIAGRESNRLRQARALRHDSPWGGETLVGDQERGATRLGADAFVDETGGSLRTAGGPSGRR